MIFNNCFVTFLLEDFYSITTKLINILWCWPMACPVLWWAQNEIQNYIKYRPWLCSSLRFNLVPPYKMFLCLLRDIFYIVWFEQSLQVLFYIYWEITSMQIAKELQRNIKKSYGSGSGERYFLSFRKKKKNLRSIWEHGRPVSISPSYSN